MGERKLMIGLCTIVVIALFTVTAGYAEVVVIANKSVTTDNINLKDLKKIFLGKKTYWDDNKKITLFVLSKSDTHKEFVRKYLGKSTSQFTNYWKQQLFTGKGMMPHRTKAEEILAKVQQTEGAIGYIDAELATSDVKKIRLK